MKHYIVISDWASDNIGEQAVEIIGITHSFDKAKELFDKRLVDEKRIAEDNGYAIYENTDVVFDAGEDGYYISEHTKLYIQMIVVTED